MRHWFSILLTICFGGVFVYSGVVKVANPIAFLDNVRSFQMLRDPFAALLAISLPWLEIFAGVAVVTGVLRSGGLLILCASLVVFLAAIGWAWAHGIDIRCGCFGGSGNASSSYVDLMARDLALLALGGTVAWSQMRGGRAKVAKAKAV
jgi:putative oxidoreductase